MAVEATNDSSVVSKLSAVDRGYWRDPYLKHFVAKPSRRAPLINRGYYIRMKAVNSYALAAFLDFRSSAEEKLQIISLGAGFDTAFFCLQDAHKEKMSKTVFYEIDLPGVVERKTALISKSDILKEKIGNFCLTTTGRGIVSDTYKLIAADLNKIEDVESALLANGLCWSAPTLLLSEVVLTYLPPERSSAVIQWASKSFRDAVFATYEQIHPSDGFGRVMTRHFSRLGSPLQSIALYSSKEEQKKRYTSLGWQMSEAIDMNEFFSNCLTLEERRRVCQMEIFDEFEEWHLKCNHYVLILSAKHTSIELCRRMLRSKRSELNQRESWDDFEKMTHTVSVPSLRRFGHATALSTTGDFILAHGGFGWNEGKHQRMADVQFIRIDADSKVVKAVECRSTGSPPDSLICHCLVPLSCGDFLLTGGRSSPTKPSSKFYRLKVSVGENEAAVVEWVEMETAGDCMVPRWRHSTNAILDDDGDEEWVFVYGGCTVGSQLLDDLFALNVKSRVLTKASLVGESPGLLHSHSGAVWGKKLIISGGMTEDEEIVGTVHLLCLEKFMKTKRIEVTCEKLPLTPDVIPVYSHTSHVVKNNLILVGGVSLGGSTTPGLTLVNLQSMAVKQLSLPHCSPEQPIMLQKHASEVVWSEQPLLIVLGGGGTCFSFGTHMNANAIIISLKNVS